MVDSNHEVVTIVTEIKMERAFGVILTNFIHFSNEKRNRDKENCFLRISLKLQLKIDYILKYWKWQVKIIVNKINYLRRTFRFSHRGEILGNGEERWVKLDEWGEAINNFLLTFWALAAIFTAADVSKFTAIIWCFTIFSQLCNDTIFSLKAIEYFSNIIDPSLARQPADSEQLLPRIFFFFFISHQTPIFLRNLSNKRRRFEAYFLWYQ